MAIRKPMPMSVKRRLDLVGEWATAVADKLEATDGALAVIDDIRGIAEAVASVKKELCVRDQRRGHRMSRQLARANESGYAEGYDDAERHAVIENAMSGADTSNAVLEWLAEDPKSKWTSPYLRRLGALEHADEVLELHRAETRAKARGEKGTYEPALRRELADMWCILEMTRMADSGFAELCEERSSKFKPW